MGRCALFHRPAMRLPLVGAHLPWAGDQLLHGQVRSFHRLAMRRPWAGMRLPCDWCAPTIGWPWAGHGQECACRDQECAFHVLAMRLPWASAVLSWAGHQPSMGWAFAFLQELDNRLSLTLVWFCEANWSV